MPNLTLDDSICSCASCVAGRESNGTGQHVDGSASVGAPPPPLPPPPTPGPVLLDEVVCMQPDESVPPPDPATRFTRAERTCGDCRLLFNHRLTMHSGVGIRLCYDCQTSARYVECDDCGYMIGSGCDCPICERDREERERERDEEDLDSNGIREYSTRVSTVPMGTGPIWAGVELEVECVGGCDRSDSARKVASLLGNFAIIKADGSLNNGFEIVTRPSSLVVHRERWAKFFNERPRGLKSWSTTTCGMHIHMTRRGIRENGRKLEEECIQADGSWKKQSPVMSDLTVAKIVIFVNSPKNYKFMIALAGRDSEQWARMYEKKGVSAALNPPARYEAVNLTTRETIEFRLFRGTLSRDGFFKNLEFAFAIKDFCATAERSFVSCQSADEFYKFVSSRRKEFPSLNQFIKQYQSSIK